MEGSAGLREECEIGHCVGREECGVVGFCWGGGRSVKLGAVLLRGRNVRLGVLLEEGRESPKAGPWWEKKIQSCTGEERR